jgi:general L-amino acid transport system permease protein
MTAPEPAASPLQSSEAPPSPGRLQRLRARLFYSPAASALTLAMLGVLSLLVVRLVDWGVVHAVLAPDPAACRAASGACWGFVVEKYRLILFGRYPYEEQWRPLLATGAILAMLVATALPALWTRHGARLLALGWFAAFTLFLALMLGGFAGLTAIPTDRWGGLPLTVILTLIGMTASAPLGILLALARRSTMPLLRLLAIGYIELVRGVPLITVLFVATFIFPLLLPAGLRLDPFWRIVIGIVLFQAAYMAETVRGGLQTIPRGQFDAAASLGLGYGHTQLHVVLPQALVAIIPAFVNSLLSTFMDTSLVTVVSMYDLTGSLRLALGDSRWRQFFIEGYLFLGAIYFAGSFAMSRYSIWLEGRLKGDANR